MNLRIGLSLTVIVGSLSLGWWLGRQGILGPPRAARLIHLLVKRLTPVVLCLALWRLDLGKGRLWLLPFIALAVSASTLLPALWYSRAARLSRPQSGSFLTCAFFSNVGFFGAFMAFALFGEQAYGLCMLYLVFFSPCFYTLGFWVASRYGHPADPAVSHPGIVDELRLYPFLGMVAGIALNLLRVPRPEVFHMVNNVLIPIDVTLHLTIIGSQITVTSFGRWLRPSLTMGAVKFLYTPVVAWLIVCVFGIQGLPRFVVLLESSMPVAVSPLVLPLLFGLDRELSSSLWLTTSLLAIPWLLIVIPLLQLI